jgi:hypothetical protein
VFYGNITLLLDARGEMRWSFPQRESCEFTREKGGREKTGGRGMGSKREKKEELIFLVFFL